MTKQEQRIKILKTLWYIRSIQESAGCPQLSYKLRLSIQYAIDAGRHDPRVSEVIKRMEQQGLIKVIWTDGFETIDVLLSQKQITRLMRAGR